jgi:hypothetical protein
MIALKRAAELAGPSPRRQIKHAALSALGVFRANRRAWDCELSVNGEPAEWTALDRARFQKYRRLAEPAEVALNRAHVLQGKPYSLAGEVLRQGAGLLGWLGLAVSGGGFAAAGINEARQPDSVLASFAMGTVRACRDYTAGDARDVALVMLAAGAAVALFGVYQIRRRFKALRAAV